MKILLLINVMLFYAFCLSAGWFAKDQPTGPRVCYFLVHISGEAEEERVYYVFQGGCDEFFQVGIIEPTRVIVLDRSLMEISNTVYNKKEAKITEIQQRWPNLEQILFFVK